MTTGSVAETSATEARPTTAFVLSGGASLGAVQVGMLQALAGRGITPDCVYGASAGAVNAAWVAGDPKLEEIDDLADVWLHLKAREIFPIRPLVGLRGFVGWRDSLVPNDHLRHLVAEHARFERLEDAPIPIAVVATEVTTGKEVVLNRGPAVEAIMASAAIPGVFPAVTIDGRHLIDGGVVNNTPLSHAVAAGAQRVYVLPTGYACALDKPPHSALAMILQAINLLVEQRLVGDVAELQDHVDLRVIPPLCPLSILPTDFSHGRELIERGYEAANRWLDRFETRGVPANQAANLGFHRH